MATDEKPLMIRGDRLLFALNVLAQFANHGSHNCMACKDWGDHGCPWLKKMRQISLVAGFADLGLAEFTDRSVAKTYYHAGEKYDKSLEHFRQMLEHMHPVDGASFEIEAVFQMINRNISMGSAYLESRMKFRPKDFLCAIATGELTEADFRE